MLNAIGMFKAAAALFEISSVQNYQYKESNHEEQVPGGGRKEALR